MIHCKQRNVVLTKEKQEERDVILIRLESHLLKFMYINYNYTTRCQTIQRIFNVKPAKKILQHLKQVSRSALSTYIPFDIIYDWVLFIIYSVTFHSELFNSYGDVTVRGESCKFRPRLGLTAFERGGFSIVSHLLWHGTSVFVVSSKRPLHLVVL